MSKTQKEAFILIGTLIATFIVLLLANQLHVDSFWLNPILIFTILTVKSNNMLQRILGLSTFVIFAIGLFFQLTYVGFLSAAINLSILSAIAYVYDDTHDTIVSSLNDPSERVIPGRWNAIFFGLIMLVFSMIPYIMLDSIWDGTILELGGKTAIIYGLTLICEYISKNQEQNAQKLIEYKKQKELASQENQTDEPQFQVSPVIKFLAVWMIVLDLSIFSYLFNQSQSGFNLAIITTLITIVLISFIQSHDDKEDVLNIIYTWLRPFQATALLVLLISHEKTVNLTIFYIILILIVHALWMLNKITIKTTLVTSSIILFIPLIGYLSNPYRFINETKPTVSDVLFEKNKMPLSSFTLSDFWKEDDKLKINNNEFYKRLNDDDEDTENKLTPYQKEKIENQKFKESKKQNLTETQIEKLKTFVEKFNELNYSMSDEHMSETNTNYLFHKASLTTETSEPYTSGSEPILTFEVNIKDTNYQNASNKNPKYYRDYLRKYGNSYDNHFRQMTNDTNLFDKIENGRYIIRFIMYSTDGEIYSKDIIFAKITDGTIDIIDYDPEN